MPNRIVELAKQAYTWFYTRRSVSRLIVSQFTRLYYQTPVPVRTWHNTTWFGTKVLKTPLDLWNYQEIVSELQPDLLIECGTAAGGSAYYFACLFELIGSGRVISVDVAENEDRPEHDRISYILGSSIARDTLDRIRDEVSGATTVMVVLDSDHSRDHVREELKLYSDFVTGGSYLIVEDTCINGHPVAPQFGPGPMEAVKSFLQSDERFVADPRDRKFLMTFNPNGYLRRLP